MTSLDFLPLDQFFDRNNFNFEEILKDHQTVISVLNSLPVIIGDFFQQFADFETPSHLKEFDLLPDAIYCRRTVTTVTPYINLPLRIYLGSHVNIEASALIKSNTIVLDSAEIRHAAYIRGHSIIGPATVVGHSSEIKGSVLLKQVAAGHFNYIGDSLVGSYVNLGAGAKLANLEFRSLADKKRNYLPTIDLDFAGKKHASKFSKLGAVIGDGSEIGCNAVTAPGCFLGPKSQVWPNVFLKKGLYPAGFLATTA